MKFISAFFFLLLIIGLGGYLYFQSITKPLDPNNTSPTSFVVTQNMSVRDIANQLVTNHLIKNSLGFLLEVKLNHLDSKLQAGDFQLSPSMSTYQIAQTMMHGPQDIWVTIPEGLRAEEIDSIFQQKLGSVYRSDWEAKLQANEGYLFPDTYSFPHDVTIDDIINTMRSNFNQKYSSVQKPTSYSQDQIVTMASIVEREGRTSGERKLIASVIKNRLSIGMALDIDAIVQYAVGYDPSTHRWWKQNLTADDLTIDSPFNSYTNPGLPPHAICNPGLDSLDAVFNSPQTTYLYYYTDPRGITHFESTFDQHTADIARYGG